MICPFCKTVVAAADVYPEHESWPGVRCRASGLTASERHADLYADAAKISPIPVEAAFIVGNRTATARCELCGSADATLDVDPFLAEVMDDDTPRWLCDLCREIRREDV